MNQSLQVSASILCADFTRLGDEIKKCEDAGVDMIHIDVMDGHFVPNISIGQVILEAVRSITQLPIETHLMIENPGSYIEDFADKGADIISIHAECYGERRENCRAYGQFPKEIDVLNAQAIRKDIQRIQDKGAKAHVVLNPGTPMCLDEILDVIDGVLIMSVNPGFANQKFMSEVLTKVKQLRTQFDGDIAIDGGIKDTTAPDAVKAGVNILATASYLFGASNPKQAVDFLKNLNP